MTIVTFFETADGIHGFCVSGHSGYADEGADIVCAAVSSAVELTVNTITDVLKTDATVNADENNAEISLILKEKDTLAADILQGLKNHLTGLCKEYPEFIKITRSVTK